MSALQRLYQALETDDPETAADIFSNNIALNLLVKVEGKGKSILQKLWELDHERGDTLFSDAVLGVENLSEKKLNQYSKAYDKITDDIVAASAAKTAAPKKANTNNASSAAAGGPGPNAVAAAAGAPGPNAVAAAAGAPGSAALNLNAANASLFPSLGTAPVPVSAPAPAPVNIPLPRQFFSLTVTPLFSNPLIKTTFGYKDSIWQFLLKHNEFNPLTIIPQLKTSNWHILVVLQNANLNSQVINLILKFYTTPTYNSVSNGLMPSLRLRHYPTEKQKEIWANLVRVLNEYRTTKNSLAPEYLEAKKFVFQAQQRILKSLIKTPELFLKTLKQYLPDHLLSKSPVDNKTILFPFSSLLLRAATVSADALLRASLEYILPGHSLDEICATGKTNKQGTPVSCVRILINYGYVTTVEYLLDNGYKTPDVLVYLVAKYYDNVFPAPIATQYASHFSRDELLQRYETQDNRYVSIAASISSNYANTIPVLFANEIFGLTTLHSIPLYTSTPLYFAAQAKNKDAVEVLLTNLGADINSLDSTKHSILYYVIAEKHYQMAPQLIAAGASLDIPGQNIKDIVNLLIHSVYNKTLPKDTVEPILSALPRDIFTIWIPGPEAATHISIASSIVVKYPEHIPILFTKGIFGLTILAGPIYSNSPLYIAAKFDVESSFDMLLTNLGADINSVDPNGLSIFFYVLMNVADIKYLEKLLAAGANPNQVVVYPDTKERVTPFCEIAYAMSRGDEKRAPRLLFLLDLPTFDIDLNLQICKQFSATLPVGSAEKARLQEAIDLLKRRKRESVKYEGYTQTELRQLNSIVQRPIDFSICPICLSAIDRDAGCLYMSHNCSQSSFFHEDLYNKYKDARGNVTWCTLCSRVCFTEYIDFAYHHHLQLKSYTEPRAAMAAPVAGVPDSIDSACLRSGGGGITEKYIRLHRMREYAYDLQEEVGKLSDYDARKQMVEEMWNAPLSRNPRVIKAKTELESVFKNIVKTRENAAGAAAAAGGPAPVKVELTPTEEIALNSVWSKYGVATTNFPENTSESLRRKAAQAASEANKLEASARGLVVPRPNGNNASLQPIDHESGLCSVCLEEKSPVTQFRHKLPDGTVNKHEDSFICRECLTNAIQNKITRRQNISAGFGKCPFYPECEAVFYPQELEGRVPPELYERYRIEFNKKILQGPIAGGMRGGVRYQIGGVPFLTPVPTGSVQCTSPNGITPTTCSKCKTRRGGRRKQQRRKRTQKCR